jgi:hypothetical protein
MTRQRNSRRVARRSQPSLRRNTGQLPQIKSNIELKHRFRFQASGTAGTITTSSITPTELLQSMGVMATSTTSGRPIFESFKINLVEAWTTSSAAGFGSTITLLWGDSTQGAANNNLEVSDTTVSSAFPAHIMTSPPRGSNASFWQNGQASVNLFEITYSAGSVVDVHVTGILLDGSAGVGGPLTLVGATVGAIYYEPLDGRATGLLDPVALTTN